MEYNVKACGNAIDEIKMQEMNEDVAGGYDSNAYGNKGAACSVTLECQSVCNWVNWSGWGFWCK